jgi:hypothetical protein
MNAAHVRERRSPARCTPAASRFLAASPELETLFLVLDPAEGHVSDRAPLPARSPLFPDGTGEPDPWQFRNVLAR